MDHRSLTPAAGLGLRPPGRVSDCRTELPTTAAAAVRLHRCRCHCRRRERRRRSSYNLSFSPAAISLYLVSNSLSDSVSASHHHRTVVVVVVPVARKRVVFGCVMSEKQSPVTDQKARGVVGVWWSCRRKKGVSEGYVRPVNRVAGAPISGHRSG
ncbi:hypothetical protein Hanom_Chr02g00118631 [Helianthus anomalus]